jgi:isopentenyl diphosphate isomerase/L-lactate dehydrogenase-like FMN-dependent dehydrogenase
MGFASAEARCFLQARGVSSQSISDIEALSVLTLPPYRYIDGGFWRGTDILKALCLGAKAVAIGRGLYYAAFTYGELGVLKAARVLQEELTAGLRLLGARSIADLKPEMVCRDDFYGPMLALQRGARL